MKYGHPEEADVIGIVVGMQANSTKSVEGAPEETGRTRLLAQHPVPSKTLSVNSASKKTAVSY